MTPGEAGWFCLTLVDSFPALRGTVCAISPTVSRWHIAARPPIAQLTRMQRNNNRSSCGQRRERNGKANRSYHQHSSSNHTSIDRREI
jgi:hypothetical protein